MRTSLSEPTQAIKSVRGSIRLLISLTNSIITSKINSQMSPISVSDFEHRLLPLSQINLVQVRPLCVEENSNARQLNGVKSYETDLYISYLNYNIIIYFFCLGVCCFCQSSCLSLLQVSIPNICFNEMSNLRCHQVAVHPAVT